LSDVQHQKEFRDVGRLVILLVFYALVAFYIVGLRVSWPRKQKQ